MTDSPLLDPDICDECLNEEAIGKPYCQDCQLYHDDRRRWHDPEVREGFVAAFKVSCLDCGKPYLRRRREGDSPIEDQDLNCGFCESEDVRYFGIDSGKSSATEEMNDE